MMRHISTGVLSFLVSLSALWMMTLPAHGDTLIMKNGDEINGRIRVVSEDKIVMDTDAGHSLFPLSQAHKAIFWGYRGVPGEDKAEDIKNPWLLQAFGMINKAGNIGDAGHVTLLSDTFVQLKKDLSSVRTGHMCNLILKERSRDLANISITFRRDREQADFTWARAIAGNEIFNLREDALSMESLRYYSKEYEKTWLLKAAVPQVNPGVAVDYAWRINSVPHDEMHPFSGAISLRGREPVMISRFTLTIPENSPVVWKLYNEGDYDIHIQEDKKDNMKQISLLSQNMSGYRSENLMPPSALIMPHLRYGFDYDWEEIIRKWNEEAAQTMKADRAIKELVASVIRDKKGEDEKARAIYRYICKEIGRIDVSMSEYSRIPKSCSEILESRIGNDLDRNALFVVMLKEAGIDAELVMLRQAGSGELIREMANLSQLNSVATKLWNGRIISPVSDKYLFSDNPSWLQGAEGLGMFSGEFFETPEVEPSENGVELHADANLRDNGDLRVEVTYTFHGESSVSRRGLRDMTDEQIRMTMESVASSRHPSARLESFDVKNLDSGTEPVKVSVIYSIKNYAEDAGNRLMAMKIPELSLNDRDAGSASDLGSGARMFPMWWGSTEWLKQTVRLTLPGRWSFRHAPEKINKSMNGVNFTADVSVKGNSMTVVSLFERNRKLIPASEVDELRALMTERDRFGREWLVISR